MFNDSDKDKLTGLEQRISKAEQDAKPSYEKEGRKSGGVNRGAIGAVKIASDLVALVMGLAFFGWLADRHFGTAPWLMLMTVIVGFVAGFWIIVRLLFKKGESGEHPKSESEKKEAKGQ